MCVPDQLKIRKAAIEREFSLLSLEGATIDVIPLLPDKLQIDIQVNRFNRKSKTIHYNEKTWFKNLFKFHCMI